MCPALLGAQPPQQTKKDPGHVGTHGSPPSSVIYCSSAASRLGAAQRSAGAVRGERLTHSEVWSREGVCGAAVLADDGGGVALLAVVVASASHAGQLADGRREDHLDPPRVVANCARKHDTSQQQRSEERRSSFSCSPIHRSEEDNQEKKPPTATARQSRGKNFETDFQSGHESSLCAAITRAVCAALLNPPTAVSREQRQTEREKKTRTPKKVIKQSLGTKSRTSSSSLRLCERWMLAKE